MLNIMWAERLGGGNGLGLCVVMHHHTYWSAVRCIILHVYEGRVY